MRDNRQKVADEIDLALDRLARRAMSYEDLTPLDKAEREKWRTLRMNIDRARGSARTLMHADDVAKTA